jgi:ABC-type glutathione transport system ATPase component
MRSKAFTDDQNMQPLIRVENLSKVHERRNLAGAREKVRALDRVSFGIFPGSTLAVVGESGSGKSTLASCLACLEFPTSGNIWFDGTDVVAVQESSRRKIRPQIQLIFQDPASSLNSRWSVLQIVVEPISMQGKFNREEMHRRAACLLERVGLSSEIMNRPPAELSGGQRQRLAIARALMLEPRLLILDEALSALDCSVQAQIANLLLELQDSLGITYLFISHDLAMAAHLADEIAVMHRGRIVEQGLADRILKHPEHETTRQLLTAVPKITRGEQSAPEE